MPDPSSTDRLLNTRLSLVQRVKTLTRHGDWLEPAALPGLALLRIEQPTVTPCSVVEPCVAVIVQGHKRVLMGEESLDYGADRYLIVSADMPVKTVLTHASAEQPYLAMALRLDWPTIAALAMDTPQGSREQTRTDGRAMTTAALTWPMLDAFDRLLALHDQPQDAAVLAPLIQREIHYRLLAGEAGHRLRQMASANTPSHQLNRAMTYLNAHFAKPLRIEALAREVGMSASTFHRQFKSLTAMSPLQYQKQLRLTEARRLMLSQRLDVASAAYRVGYESASQFSREYRRLFGTPPSADTVDKRWEREQPAL